MFVQCCLCLWLPCNVQCLYCWLCLWVLVLVLLIVGACTAVCGCLCLYCCLWVSVLPFVGACACTAVCGCLYCRLWVWQISPDSKVWVAGTGPNCFITLLYNLQIFIREGVRSRSSLSPERCHFSSARKKHFHFTKSFPNGIIGCVERGFYKKITRSPVSGEQVMRC